MNVPNSAQIIPVFLLVLFTLACQMFMLPCVGTPRVISQKLLKPVVKAASSRDGFLLICPLGTFHMRSSEPLTTLSSMALMMALSAKTGPFPSHCAWSFSRSLT